MNRARSRDVKTGDYFHQGAFATASGSDNPDQLTLRDFKRYVFKKGLGFFADLEGNVLEFKHGLRF